MGARCPHSPLRGTGWLTGWRLTFGGEEHGWDGALATIVEDPLEQVGPLGAEEHPGHAGAHHAEYEPPPDGLAVHDTRVRPRPSVAARRRLQFTES